MSPAAPCLPCLLPDSTPVPCRSPLRKHLHRLPAMTTFTYLLAVVAVVAALCSRAECRPQTPETRDVEAVAGNDQRDQPVFFSEAKYGTIAGEIFVGTDDLVVSKRQKKPRSGPSVSALVAGPPEVSVGVSAGLSLVPQEAKVEVVAAR